MKFHVEVDFEPAEVAQFAGEIATQGLLKASLPILHHVQAIVREAGANPESVDKFLATLGNAISAGVAMASAAAHAKAAEPGPTDPAQQTAPPPAGGPQA